MILTVIIPTYNRVDLIKFTLDSLAKVHHKETDFEIIVVDDGSNDDTIAFIKNNYPSVILLTNAGKGAGAARNTGLSAAKGKYIVYLDSDDLIGENYFDKKIALLESRPDLNACYGAYEFFKSDGEFNRDHITFKHKYPLIFSDNTTKEHLLNYLSGNFLPPNTIIWRKDLLVTCKGHDESLAVNQDVDLFFRAIFNGLKIVALQDGTEVYIRNHSLDERVGNAGNSRKKWLQILELRKKILKELKEYGYDSADCYRALSNYLFDNWKLLRHSEPAIAAEYLKLAKEISWPVQIKGNILYRTLSNILGPVRAVNLKYFLLKRD